MFNVNFKKIVKMSQKCYNASSMENTMHKSTKQFILALKILLGCTVAVPLLNIIFFSFSWSNFLCSVSMICSMSVTVFSPMKQYTKKEIKMTGLFITACLMPLLIMSSILFAYSNPTMLKIMNLFPIYTMFPMLAIGYATIRIAFKTLESNASSLSSLAVSEQDEETVLNFTNKIFYEKYGQIRVDVGESVVHGSDFKIDKLTSNYIDAVSEFLDIAKNKLTVDDFIVYDMSKI